MSEQASTVLDASLPLKTVISLLKVKFELKHDEKCMI